MSYKKIPDRSNFLEKFAAIEGFLKKKVQPESKSNNKESEEAKNSQYLISEIPTLEKELKCNKCGSARNIEDVFCGTCGNKLQPN